MKYTVYAPNTSYSGESASVLFKNGIGETENDHLADWFRSHGYTVREESEMPQPPSSPSPSAPLDDASMGSDAPTVQTDISKLNFNSLKALAKRRGITAPVGTTKDDLIKILTAE